jgi:hypothetical protein
MRFNFRLPTRVALLPALMIASAFFGAMVLAQSEPALPGDHPEANTDQPPAINPVAAPGDTRAPDAPATEVTLYKFIAGQSFHPREATTNVQYGGAGCVYRNTPSGFVVSDLQLPQNAVVESIRVYFYDTNADQELDFYLYDYDALGTFRQLATVSSSGSAGRGTADTGPIGHIVDNAAAALGLVVGMDGANNSTVQLCGVRVEYTIDVPSYTLLPAVVKETTGD